ncbi:hypothetical protein DH2020_012883 [Rehmannia glutinosa]|uniref:Uncharacterized protein n=1 Tax=Rehmannia glutinosa TaxID=99300 RepID=A0ABR0X431_REHGL
MAKTTCTETNMILEPVLNVKKIIVRRPTRKSIPGNGLAFKNLSYSFLKGQRKDISVQAMRGENMAIIKPSGVEKSKDDSVPSFIQERFIFIRETSHKAYRVLSYVVSSLIAHLQFFAVQVLHLQTIALFFLRSLQNISKYWKWPSYISTLLINGFKGAKSVKGKAEGILGKTEISKLHNTTSATKKKKWRLIDIDASLLLMEVYSIDTFFICICILLAWGLLSRLFSYVVRRFYSKDDTN